MLEINRIYNMDCLEGMRQMPDESVDLVIADPPYGIGESNEKNLSRGTLAKPKDYGSYDWDKERLEKSYFDEMLRVSKNQLIFGGNYYIDYLHPSPCWIVWDKDNGNNDFADCELIWGSFTSAVRLFKWRWNGMLKERPEERFHPTQKPVALIEWLVENYSEVGATILDPFIGSGTTAVACKKLNRNFIGFEREKKYCDIAEKRLRGTQPLLPEVLKAKPSKLEAFCGE
ncbi:MAG: site-specific DNA-methyltransferase [Calditrichia bacterium]